jgi:SAM-dependent methyltransferase
MSKIGKFASRACKLFSRSPEERALAYLEFWGSFKHRTAQLTQKSASDYLKMQHQFYERAASVAKAESGKVQGDIVVGSWDQQQKWPDYETYLLKYVPLEPVWLALEYGCGPGRNIRGFSSRFGRIDGVDISEKNLANAEKYLKGQIPADKCPRLYLTQGSDAGAAQANAYDFSFSTICFQHICVWEVRFSILKSLYSCLKPGGRLSIQMGYGPPTSDKYQKVPYQANFYGASSTNSGCDVTVSDPEELHKDLQQIGFTAFEYWIRPAGPDPTFSNWIFFTCLKPSGSTIKQ